MKKRVGEKEEGVGVGKKTERCKDKRSACPYNVFYASALIKTTYHYHT